MINDYNVPSVIFIVNTHRTGCRMTELSNDIMRKKQKQTNITYTGGGHCLAEDIRQTLYDIFKFFHFDNYYCLTI